MPMTQTTIDMIVEYIERHGDDPSQLDQIEMALDKMRMGQGVPVSQPTARPMKQRRPTPRIHGGSGNIQHSAAPVASPKYRKHFMGDWTDGEGDYCREPQGDHDSIHYTPEESEYVDDDFERAQAEKERIWNITKGMI